MTGCLSKNSSKAYKKRQYSLREKRRRKII